MSEEENGATREITGDELAAMTPECRNNAIMKAVKIRGKVLVRGKDGKPKYANPERAGNYGEETIGDLP